MKFIIVAALICIALADDSQTSVNAPAPDGDHLVFKGQKHPPGVKVGPHSRPARQTSCGVTSTLTSTQQQEAIKAHNYCRAQEPAANMISLTYSDEMARVAQAYANQCIWAHGMLNDCSGNRLGQNLYVTANPSGYPPLNLTNVVLSWNSEIKYWDAPSATCQNGQECGHYTQNVWARSAQMGCGFAQCPKITVGGSTWTNAILVVCDYTPAGNVVGQPLYQTGPACSNCDSEGTGAGYKCSANLCVKCTPATDSTCKCGNPLACQNGGNWNPNTCSCSCPGSYYGTECEVPCTCGDALDCSSAVSSCTDPDLTTFMNQFCKGTCKLPCNLPKSCTQII